MISIKIFGQIFIFAFCLMSYVILTNLQNGEVFSTTLNSTN